MDKIAAINANILGLCKVSPFMKEIISEAPFHKTPNPANSKILPIMAVAIVSYFPCP